MFSQVIFVACIFLGNLLSVSSEDKSCPLMLLPFDLRENKNKLRLMQYNVEWLFIDYYAQADCPGKGCTWKNESDANTHLKTIANIIDKLQPDLINLCEVEGCNELNILNDNLKDMAYSSYLIQGTDTATGQNVGFMTTVDPYESPSRIPTLKNKYEYPVQGSMCGYAGKPGNVSVSKHYISYFDFMTKNLDSTNYYFSESTYDTIMIGAHLLAYPTDTSRCAEREAQAQILQNTIVEYIIQGYNIIVLGDFNDYDGLILDANNDKPTSMVLDIIKGLKGDHQGKYELYSAAEYTQQSTRKSDWWDKNNNCKSTPDEFTVIDHILVSKRLREKIKNVFFYSEYDEFCGTYNSDHYPLVVDFDFSIV
jgi:exonuclease III